MRQEDACPQRFSWFFKWIRKVQKRVNLVDLVKSFPRSIYFQKSASIRPRTSLSKFGRKFNSFQIQDAFHPRVNDDQDKQTIVLRPGHFFQLHQTFRGTPQSIGDQKHQLVVVVVGLFLGQLPCWKKERKEVKQCYNLNVPQAVVQKRH